MSKTVFLGRMQTGAERETASTVEKYLRQVGLSQAVDRFLKRYAKASTKRAASYQLWRHFGWLKTEKGVAMRPDELVLDNLGCVFEIVPAHPPSGSGHIIMSGFCHRGRTLSSHFP